ncbi:MAG: VWA domain-containing protein, partial [Chloroflexi bacterium]|nr:VWA domain-containing protein [Chloroflexota bacterium]
MSQEFDYYAVLGLSPDASTEEIREAFTVLRSAFPAEQRDPATNTEFRRIFNAYEVLSDPARRATYDSLVLETSSSALTVDVKASRKEVAVSESNQMLYLLVNILPPQQSSQQRPLNLSLVIDRSTSMKGNRLNNVKTAVELLVEQLTPEDTLSIISFSDRAEVVVEAAPVVHKMPIASRVRSIRASGGTEIYQGLYAGVKELRKANTERCVNQLILLTDGHTYGDIEQCLDLAKQVTREDIGFSAFGIGTEWNDQFLDALVTPSSGQSG